MNEIKYAKIYIVLVLLITWIATGILFINSNIGIRFFPLIMFIPGILAVIINSIQYKNKRKLYKCFVVKINKKSLAFGIFYPIIFVFTRAVIAYVSGFGSYNDKAFIEGMGILTDGNILIIRDLIILIISSIVSLPSVLGEEYGWRGYLFPELTEKYGEVKATCIVGIVWGLFHIPAVFLLGKIVGVSNPLLLCIVQAIAAFTYSFPSSYCFYLSGNIIPVLFIHSVWNSVNVIVLGDIYRSNYGIIKGNIMAINGEGIIGAVLGIFMIFWFIKKFNDSKQKKYHTIGL